jgi:multidrug resistance efflux pump
MYSSLQNSGGVSQREFLNARHDLNELKDELSGIASRKSDMVLTAPASGVATNLQLQNGVYIKIKQPVMSLVQDDEKWIYCYINQSGMRYI